jgi:hypothetical protein
MRIERCMSCGAPILWARTGKRGWMPLDAEPVPNGNLRFGKGHEIKHVPPGHRETLRAEGVELYQSHYATCPDAAHWRNRSRKERSAGKQQDLFAKGGDHEDQDD